MYVIIINPNLNLHVTWLVLVVIFFLFPLHPKGDCTGPPFLRRGASGQFMSLGSALHHVSRVSL